MNAIEFKNVWEKYRIKFIISGRVSWEEIWALEDVSFNVNKGEVLGVIGQNGSGKTTLLKLIAGMLICDRGQIAVNGKVSMLMELGAGFNPEFTGRENVTLNARLYGLEEDLDKRIEKIMDFTGLGKFIDAPIKHYSQGMFMRLAFALAVFVEPEIFLIDDILAVGDQEAQQKCMKKIFELKQAGTSIVLVSHDMNMISALCSRVLLLERGKIVKEGPPQKVIPYYLDTVGDKNGIAVLRQEGLRVIFNNGKVNVTYNDMPLTKTMGGYVAFFATSLNSWLSSFNLTWRIKSCSPDALVAEGISLEGAVSQIWNLSLKDSWLKWLVEVKEEPVKEAHIDVAIDPVYQEWQALDKKNDFPPFIHKANWQDLGKIDLPEGILSLNPLQGYDGFPGIVVRAEGTHQQVRLFNTGYEQEARIVQVYSNSNNLIAIDMGVFRDRGELGHYLSIHREKFLFRQKSETEEILKQRSLTSGSLRIFADLEHKSLKLFYKDKEITKGSGLHSSYYANQKWIDSQQALWQGGQTSDKEIMLSLNYEALSLTEIWFLNCHENDVLHIRIEIEAKIPISLTDHRVKLELQEKYARWFTTQEEGDFSVTSYMENLSPVRLKDRRVCQVALKAEAAENLPALSFDSLSSSDRRILGICKYKEAEEEYVNINFSLIIPKKEELIQSGRYTYFKGRIALNQNINLEEEVLLTPVAAIKRDHLKLIFDHGRGKVFAGEKEGYIYTRIGNPTINALENKNKITIRILWSLNSN